MKTIHWASVFTLAAAKICFGAGLSPAPAPPANPPPAASQSIDPMAHSQDMGGMSGMDRTPDTLQRSGSSSEMADDMQMTGMYGSYEMSREASGTSWQPDATPEQGVMFMNGQSMTMIHGYADTVYDDQGGRRGSSKAFSESMFMVMSERRLNTGTWGFRGMFSLDPTIGESGYPLLFGTGETADGKTPLIDRQHPHNLFMELATTYSIPLSEKASVFGYLGLPGEPALGPPAFMHRFSGEDNPEAPISHHWFDATHITEGVATLGYIQDAMKIEGSIFNGREPAQFRWGIEPRSFDSASARISWNPTQQLSLQLSEGYLKSPEQLEPEQSVVRRTVSAIYQSDLDGSPWGTTFAWGQNRRAPGLSTGAWLLESTIRLTDHYTLFCRAERLANDELFAPGDPLAGRVFEVSKLSIGAIDDLYMTHHIAFGIGALISRFAHAAELDPVYGHPTSYMVFVRAKIAK